MLHSPAHSGLGGDRSSLEQGETLVWTNEPTRDGSDWYKRSQSLRTLRHAKRPIATSHPVTNEPVTTPCASTNEPTAARLARDVEAAQTSAEQWTTVTQHGETSRTWVAQVRRTKRTVGIEAARRRTNPPPPKPPRRTNPMMLRELWTNEATASSTSGRRTNPPLLPLQKEVPP